MTDLPPKAARRHQKLNAAPRHPQIRLSGVRSTNADELNPILVDSESGIIAGHGRVLAAKKLGLLELPVMVADGWSEAQKRAQRCLPGSQTSPRTVTGSAGASGASMNAGWDSDLLKIELDGPKALNFDLALTGFSLDEIGILTADKTDGLTELVAGLPPSAAGRMMLPVSNDTLLRIVRRRASIPSGPLNVIGIDDWAWRRNHRYGTIVCRRNLFLPLNGSSSFSLLGHCLAGASRANGGMGKIAKIGLWAGCSGGRRRVSGKSVAGFSSRERDSILSRLRGALDLASQLACTPTPGSPAAKRSWSFSCA